MGKTVLIIGAGIAGLSAASYLQRNGFDTEIFELHDKAGGLCTAWKRDGFTFDGCIHWLMGSGRTSNLHEIWRELGAGELDYVEWESYTTIRLSDGDSFTVYTDPDRLEKEMLRLAPGDRRAARALSRNVARMKQLDLPAAFDKMSARQVLALLARLPSALLLLPWLRRSVGDLVAMMEGEKLREAFRRLLGDAIDSFPALALFMMLGFMAKRSSGYPIGGSLAFAQAIERKYLDLGGRLRYRSRVDEILVEGGRAVGLRGVWGEARGDYVVSAADGHDTLARLLGGRFRHPQLDAAFAAAERGAGTDGGLRRYPSLLYVGLGLGRDWSNLPHMQAFTLDEPICLEGGALKLRSLSLRLFHFDPTSAPKGKTAATVMVETANDAYWSELRDRDPVAYREEKAEAARRILAALETFVPGLSASVETIDVATPCSFIRYTNNWHGSYEGWLPTGGSLGKRMARTLPGLDGFYLIGQWLSPGGGLPPCGIGGRALAKKLCRLEGRRFRPD
jgi:phytoene dehydrogenase-like protein